MSAAVASSQSSTSGGSVSFPLCVDLDGTLVRTNLMYECLLACLRLHPFLMLLLPFWAWKGQAYLWSQLVRFVSIDPSSLPYSPEVLGVVRSEHSRGREVVLVTGTHRRVAEAIAGHLGLFSEVIATEGRIHCTGGRKAQQLVERYGANGFDYIGDSRKDLPVWYASNAAILVNPPRGAAARLDSKQIPNITLAAGGRGTAIALLKAVRPHQAVKNLLVFSPVFLSHHWADWTVMRAGLLVFFAFCCVSFAGYLFNDVLDLEADRRHRSKRKRPIASGSLPMPAAVLALTALPVLGVATGRLVSVEVAALVAGYFLFTVLYSSWLKTVCVVDVVLLAGLYCYRVLAGGVATRIVISPWTLAFSLFLFLSLAVMKRYAELHASPVEAGTSQKRRNYGDEDKPLLAAFGSASAMLAVLVIALYVNSDDVRILYQSPRLLWLMCPLVLVWIMRLWMIAGRGRMDEDPVLYAVKDRWTYGIGIAAILLVLAGM